MNSNQKRFPGTLSCKFQKKVKDDTYKLTLTFKCSTLGHKKQQKITNKMLLFQTFRNPFLRLQWAIFCLFLAKAFQSSHLAIFLNTEPSNSQIPTEPQTPRQKRQSRRSSADKRSVSAVVSSSALLEAQRSFFPSLKKVESIKNVPESAVRCWES